MSKIEGIPTSKLVFETVYPGHIDVVSSVGIEEEIFLRLTREFCLPPEVVHKLIHEDQEKIRARGSNIRSYFFNGNKSLDESLNAIYGGIDHIGRLVSTFTSLSKYTFSEYAYFNGVMSTLWDSYRKRQELWDASIQEESDNISEILSSGVPFREKEAHVAGAERRREELTIKRDREAELIDIYRIVNDLCLTKSLDCLDTAIGDMRAVLRLAREMVRVYSTRMAVYNKELINYVDIDNDFYQHDIDLLNQNGASGYSFTKK